VIALLLPSQGTLRAGEGNRDLPLAGITRIDQEDRRIRLGHRVTGTVVVHGKASDHHDAVFAVAAQATAPVDDEGLRRHRRRQRQFLLDGHAPVLQHPDGHRP
jgi:hypothetical protein